MEIIAAGTHNQTKAIIEALVDHVDISEMFCVSLRDADRRV